MASVYYVALNVMLTVESRPVTCLQTIGSRLTPDQLLSHRQTHTFKAPCCLCASVDPDLGYTETAILVSESKEFVSKYVAECASKMCGYIGKSSLML